MGRSTSPIVVSGLLGMLLLQCRVDERIAYEPPESQPELVNPSAVGDAGCPGSRFLCDVNLKTDPNNCGACGVQCPKTERPANGIFTDPHDFARSWSCVDGRCVLACNGTTAMDCDGFVDNGCETLPSKNDSCGACGNVCADPAKPCLSQPSGEYACGCPPGWDSCGLPLCLPLLDDDLHCGACSNRCNPNGDAGAPPANAYYGCAGGECGHLKCVAGMGNCDDDSANGCETPLTTNQNCGACDNACAAGQTCLFDKVANGYRCLCPPGLTYCDRQCVDLSSDDSNCGTCGNICGVPGSKVHVGLCSYGTCAFSCSTGWADCNGNPRDGCEVNTMSDPQNCGGCGVICDGIAGQACAGGRCVVEPCDQDGGVTAR